MNQLYPSIPRLGRSYLRLASIWLTRPSTQRRTNSGRDTSSRLAQRVARTNSERGTLVLRTFVGFIAMASEDTNFETSLGSAQARCVLRCREREVNHERK